MLREIKFTKHADMKVSTLLKDIEKIFHGCTSCKIVYNGKGWWEHPFERLFYSPEKKRTNIWYHVASAEANVKPSSNDDFQNERDCIREIKDAICLYDSGTITAFVDNPEFDKEDAFNDKLRKLKNKHEIRMKELLELVNEYKRNYDNLSDTEQREYFTLRDLGKLHELYTNVLLHNMLRYERFGIARQVQEGVFSFIHVFSSELGRSSKSTITKAGKLFVDERDEMKKEIVELMDKYGNLTANEKLVLKGYKTTPKPSVRKPVTIKKPINKVLVNKKPVNNKKATNHNIRKMVGNVKRYENSVRRMF